MSMHAVRIAFMDAAASELRLDHAGLSYQGGRQVLSFTGWHAHGAPFAMVTAPFEGNPVTRAGEAARDIIAAHAGPVQTPRSKVMSQKGSGLARLMGGLKSLDAGADALATRLEAAMTSLQSEMATTTQIVGNVEASVTDLRAVNALYSNGGPPLPTSAGSQGTSGAPSSGQA
jgi:hypothetical protein